jgi:beta-lactam-binding protein with PASTA domain
MKKSIEAVARLRWPALALLVCASTVLAQQPSGTVRVPNFRGDTRERAFAKVPDDQLRLRFVETPSSNPPGRVFSQSPAANTVVRRGAEVQLTIALPIGATVPSVIGLRVTEALQRLERFSPRQRSVPSFRTAGEVIDQDPRAPAQRAAGSVVVIDVSDGSRVLVPRVSGRSEADARARLATNDLVAEMVPQEADRAPGLVVSQEPPEGSAVDRRSRVRLIVSTGLALPKGVGESLDEARRRLAGFEVEASEVPSAEGKGMVVEQDPPASSRVAAGARVRLGVSDGSLVAVPDLQSTTLSHARTTLKDAGLALVVSSGPDTANAVVKSQRPEARTVVKRGGSVEIAVRPPTWWIAGVLGVLALAAGYFVWLWRRVPATGAQHEASPTADSRPGSGEGDNGPQQRGD